MRCFIAVDIDDGLRRELANLQSSLRAFTEGKMVEPENLHFTFKFLGEVAPTRIDEVRGLMAAALEGAGPLEIQVKGIGAFPNLNNIRVLWVGAPGLFNLQKAVCDAFGGEEKITPHITLMRVNRVLDRPAVKAFLERHRETVFGTVSVNEVRLKSSSLTPHGPVYKDVFALNLAVC